MIQKFILRPMVHFTTLYIFLLTNRLINTENHASMQPQQDKVIDYYGYPQYAYSYGVSDHNTGDFKDAYESRDGNFVHGRYSVLQPDGILRVVTYTSDPWHGFQAKVSMLNGYSQHPIPKTLIQTKRPRKGFPEKSVSLRSVGHYSKNVGKKYDVPHHKPSRYELKSHEKVEIIVKPNQYKEIYLSDYS